MVYEICHMVCKISGGNFRGVKRQFNPPCFWLRFSPIFKDQFSPFTALVATADCVADIDGLVFEFFEYPPHLGVVVDGQNH